MSWAGIIGATLVFAWFALIVIGIVRGIHQEHKWRREGWRPVRHAALGRKVWAKRGRDIDRKP